MKRIQKISAFVLVFALLLGQGALAAQTAPVQQNELAAAVALAEEAAAGGTAYSFYATAGFNLDLCYSYVSMLYRDYYLLRYMSSSFGSALSIEYDDADKHYKAVAAAAEIVGEIVTPGMTDREKLAAIQTYLRQNCVYDDHSALNQALGGDAYTAYGALVNKSAVCDGISAAFQMMCREAGIPCMYVGSEAMNHSWNIVFLENKIYHVDVTYDLNSSTGADYFLLSGEDMAKTHIVPEDMIYTVTSYVWDVEFHSALSLSRVGLFRGTDKGWELYRVPTRAEAAIMLVRFLGMEEQALNEYETMETVPFTDVNRSHLPYITLLYSLGLTNGTSETTFSPQQPVTARDFTTLMLRAFGYDDGAGDFSWELSVDHAVNFGITTPEQATYFHMASFDRGAMAFASLCFLKAEMKDGTRCYEWLISKGAIDEKTTYDMIFSLDK